MVIEARNAKKTSFLVLATLVDPIVAPIKYCLHFNDGGNNDIGVHVSDLVVYDVRTKSCNTIQRLRFDNASNMTLPEGIGFKTKLVAVLKFIESKIDTNKRRTGLGSSK